MAQIKDSYNFHENIGIDGRLPQFKQLTIFLSFMKIISWVDK